MYRWIVYGGCGDRMLLTRLQIRNYKCFLEPADICFGEGFNIVVGANSSGKTALLEVLLNEGWQHAPHRSVVFGGASQVKPHSSASMEVRVSGPELKDAIIRSGKDIPIPLPPEVGKDSVALNYIETRLLGADCNTNFHLRRLGDGPWMSRSLPSHGLFERTPHGRHVPVGASADRQSVVTKGGVAQGDKDQLGVVVANLLSTIYVFRAERLNIGKSQIVADIVLNRDASNLPSALHLLQARNPHQFDRLNRLVQQVLPTIERITVVPVSLNEVEIRVWSSGYEQEREDLAIPMAACGTGVGQVLAILYLALTSKSPRTIVIDEPSSFLHPSATRELLEVLRAEGRHQYILSTHAPEVISAAEPTTLTVLRWNGSETEAKSYMGADLTSTRVALGEVGARLSDVFGFDRVVWVEGPTEAACFPAIVRARRGRTPAGVAFVPIVNTGDLERKGHYTRLVGQIYRQLTSQSALMPQTMAMSLDREDRTESEKSELIRAVGAKVFFLPRRTIENYLIHPEAILRVLQENLPTDLDSLTADEIALWIEKHAAEPKYKGGSIDDAQHKLTWLVKVDAPRLLADLFAQFTDHKLEFRKVQHSVGLVQWLLGNQPRELDELSEYVESLLEGSSGRQAI